MSDTIAVDYVFNVKPAQENITKLSHAFGGLDSKTNETMRNASKASQSINVGAKIGASAVAVGNLMSGGILKVFDLIVSSLPKIMDWIKSLGVDIDGMLAPFQDIFKPVLEEIGGWIKSNSDGIKKLFGFFAGAASAASQLVMQAFGILKRFVMAVFDGIFTKGKFTFDSFVNMMNLALLKIVFVLTMLQILLEPLFLGIGKLFNGLLQNAIIPFWSSFSESFLKNLNIADIETDGFFTEFKKLIDGIDWSPLKEISIWLGENLGEFFANLINDIILTGKTIIGWGKLIIGFFDKIDKAVLNFELGVIYLIKDVKKFWSELWDNAGAKFENFVSAAKNKFQEFKTMVKSIIDSIFSWFSDLPNKIKQAVSNGVSFARSAIKGTWIEKGAETLGLLEKQTSETTIQPTTPQPITTSTAITNQPTTSTTNNSNVVTVNVNGSTNPQATAQAVAREIEKKSLASEYNKTKLGKGQ